AAAQPALVDHRDIGDAVLLGEVIGRAEAVTAGADDHHVVFGPGLGLRPLRVPALVAGHRVPENGHCGETGHRRGSHRFSLLSPLSRLAAIRACTDATYPRHVCDIALT